LIHPAVEDPVGKSLLAADQGGVFRVFTRRQRQNLPHIHIGNQPPESNRKPTFNTARLWPVPEFEDL
jgi:hypothetical protein